MELSPELKPIIDRANHSQLKMTLTSKLGKSLKTEGEVRPRNIAPVIALDRKSMTPTVFPMVWGFTNPYKSGAPLVNARIETASQKSFWKESWNKHRCIIPASYYFEWQHYTAPDGSSKTGQKYMIQTKGSVITYLAGLYAIEERNGISVPVYTILTREPGDGIRFIHDRMPVIFTEKTREAWLDRGADPAKALERCEIQMRFEIA
jgi:putative SOS response-associated peptidase YedK